MHLLSSQSPEDSVAMLAMMLLSWLLCGPRMMVMKSHKRFKKEQSSKSDSTSDDSEEMKKREHWKHKHSGGKHLKKCHHHELHSLSENSNESGSDEDQRSIYNGREVISIIRSFRSVSPLPLHAHLYTAGNNKFGSGLKFLPL